MASDRAIEKAFEKWAPNWCVGASDFATDETSEQRERRAEIARAAWAAFRGAYIIACNEHEDDARKWRSLQDQIEHIIETLGYEAPRKLQSRKGVILE